MVFVEDGVAAEEDVMVEQANAVFCVAWRFVDFELVELLLKRGYVFYVVDCCVGEAFDISDVIVVIVCEDDGFNGYGFYSKFF